MPRQRVVAIGNSSYAADRARQLLADRDDTVIAPSQPSRRVVFEVGMGGADLVYLVDIGATTVIAGLLAWARGSSLVVDTGDLAFALARSTGSRGFLGLLSVGVGEQLLLRMADTVVVRGRRHVRWLPRGSRWEFIPDVQPPSAIPADGSACRLEAGIPDGAFVVGVVGSFNEAKRLGTTYGWDIVAALAQTPATVHGLFVGDGPGLGLLRDMAQRQGVANRCHFVGRVPTSTVHEWIGAMDVAISTQTNDPVGAVRTTGKLPLYLACGCPVIATDVGEAQDILGALGWTLPYSGRVDSEYPSRLASALCHLQSQPEQAPVRRALALDLSRRYFNRADLQRRLSSVIDSALARRTKPKRRGDKRKGIGKGSP